MTWPTTGIPASLHGSSYLSGSPWAAGTWSEVRRHIPTALLPELADCVYVMLKPDALAAHVQDAFFGALSSAGLQVVQSWPCLRSGPREYEELYKFNLTLQNEQNMLSHWWLTSRQFTIGHSIALLVRVPEKVRGERTAYEYFGELKGPSNPYLARPGQLRYDLRATNLALNMVHCADDPLCTAREALIFGNTAQVIAGLRCSADLRAGTTDRDWAERAAEQFAQAVRAVRAPRVDVRLVPVLTTVKLRVRGLASEEVQQATASTYRSFLEHADREDLSVGEAWKGFEYLSEQECRLLDSLSPTDRAGALLRELADISRHDLDFARRVATEAAGLGIPLTAWDELVLDTALYYRSHRVTGSSSCVE
ncbi:nucleoside-diphosphate kinase [Streptomyces aureus]